MGNRGEEHRLRLLLLSLLEVEVDLRDVVRQHEEELLVEVMEDLHRYLRLPLVRKDFEG